MKVLFVVSVGRSKYYVGEDLQRAIDKARMLEANRARLVRPVRNLLPIHVQHWVV